MSSLKLLAVLGVLMLGASVALADGTDPIISPGRGPTGSPPAEPEVSLDVICPTSICGVVVDDFTVNDGTLTAVSVTFPEQDVSLGITCGQSDAFLDLGLFNGNTCKYSAYSGSMGEVIQDLSETDAGIATLEAECLAYNEYGSSPPNNSTVTPDAAACIGIPSGTDQSDLQTLIQGAVEGVPLTANLVITPEPSSLALLVLGLGFVAIFACRRKQLA